MRLIRYLFFVAGFLVGDLHASEEIPPSSTLAPIVIEGSPSDLLDLDVIRPQHGDRTGQLGGSGSIERGLSRDLAIPMNDYGKPGSASAIRGMGRSSEDVGTEALGVPLNYGQGGGFDLSIFPQFIWSDYRFQMGPSLGAYDPRAVSGSLTLVPWSESALSDPKAHHRVSQSYSGLGLSQTSVAGKGGENFAAVAGYSAGEVKGPSGALSSQWKEGQLRARFHLLGTDLEANVSGPLSSPTPLAKQRTARVIPVLQGDYQAQGMLIKTSAFYDLTYLRYEDPASVANRGRNHLSQFGTENAVLMGPWRWGVGARWVSFRQTAGELPREDIFNSSLTRTFIADHLTTEAMVQGVGVSQFGFFPGGSLGSRYEIPVDEITHAFFVRAGYSNRFPTLIDRYYIDPSFMGNSGVTPERDTTVTGGYEWSSNEVHATLEGYYQYRDNVLLPTYNAATFTTIANTGTASISSLLHSLKWAVVPWLDLGHSLSLTQSEVHSTGAAFPYVPSSLYRLYLDVHSVDQPENWNAGFDLRTSSSASVTQTTSVADYTVFDFNAGVRFSPLRLTTKVENVFGVRYQVIRDYLMPGRTYSILGVLDF